MFIRQCMQATILTTLFGTSALTFAQESNKLPPVSNYYPKCDNTLLSKTKVDLKTATPHKRETKLKLITQIQQEAAEFGADLVILAHKDVKSFNLGKFDKPEYFLIFRAEFHRECYKGEEHDRASEVARYNEFGEKTITFYKAESIPVSIQLSKAGANQFNHPEITNNEISLKNGIYGIELGTTVDKVKDVLGDPSAQLDIYNNEQVLLYGRRQAFHFQSNELVKFDSDFDGLSQSFSNTIPIRSSFDEQNWALNANIEKHALLSQVESALGEKITLDDKNNFSLQNSKQKMQLHFSYITNQETYEKQYYLDSLVLTQNGYKQNPYRASKDSQLLYRSIDSLFQTLTNNELVQKQTLNNALEEPLALIWDTPETVVKVFNDHLLVRQKYDRLTEITFMEHVFNAAEQQPTSIPWYLGQFTQGGKKSELRPLLLEEVSELDDKVIMESDWYQISLTFDDNELNQANLVLY